MPRKDDAVKVVVRPLYDDAERAADDGPRQCARDYRAVKLQQVGRDDHRDRALAVLFIRCSQLLRRQTSCLVPCFWSYNLTRVHYPHDALVSTDTPHAAILSVPGLSVNCFHFGFVQPPNAVKSSQVVLLS